MSYPKMLYLKGWEDTTANVVVNTLEEEKEARSKGYKAMDDKPRRTRKKKVTDDGDQ